MNDNVYLMTAEEDLRYHIMGDPVKDGFSLRRGETRRILGSVLKDLKVAKMKGKGKANFRLEKEGNE